MLVDTHAHVNFSDFKEDFDQVLKRAHDNDIAVINVGSQISTSRRAVELAQNYKKTFAAVGLHPIHLQDFQVKEEHATFHTRAEEFDYNLYLQLAQLDQVVAIGECGLDYFHLNSVQDIISAKKTQKYTFNQQIDLANEAELPMIIHCRGSRENEFDAYQDLLSELKKNLPKKRGVIHSFLADWKIAEQFLELGFYLGFNGVITFDKTGRTAEVLSAISLDRILTETDCPYLTPEPFRGKRNEPLYVKYVASKIAQIKQLALEQIQEKTTQNAKNMFNLIY